MKAFYIAGMKNVQLVSERIAIVNSYLYQNRQMVQRFEQATTIGFLDIGHSKASFFIAKLQAGVVPEILYHVYDHNLGGRNLDWELL